MEVVKKGPMSAEVRVQHTNEQTFKYLLISDAHIDNPKCKREILLQDLEKARIENAPIFIFGDLFCLMQGKYDPRSNKGDIRPEHNRANYIDSVIVDTAKILAPYAHLIVVISDGNHETSIIKRLETDPIERLVEYLKEKYKSPCVHLPYMGFILMRFERGKGCQVKTSTWFYSHGHWGGVISKGTQSAMRYAALAPQSDLIYSGHTHDRNMVELMRYSINQIGEVKVSPQLYLKGGCYKEEFETGSGWAVEKLGLPKNIGGWWVTATVSNKVHLSCQPT